MLLDAHHGSSSPRHVLQFLVGMFETIYQELELLHSFLRISQSLTVLPQPFDLLRVVSVVEYSE